MQTNNAIEQVKQWSEQIGILTPKNVSLTIEFIATACENANTMPIEEVETLLLKISAYNLYIKSMKGSIIAKLTQCEGKIKRRMFIILPKVGDTQYKTKEEKEAMASDIDTELSELFDEALVLRMKLSKVKDVPYAIDSIIDTIKMVYQKRLNGLSKN